ncbi:pulmonary surfactant-associated protein A-like [Dermochelys coriacea]|uniref:pulmonary surfactant-associated protein A-like n=1 Tax=Dermochelys coriacea TaxID=27794 RepID=UPI0018E8A24A|nr:pulmonary surfactant-associated protein A-like [Dermochelys coriacea]
MLPQLFHIVTAIAFLLVTCHAWDHHEGIHRIPGLNGLPVKEGTPGLKAYQGLRGLLASHVPKLQEIIKGFKNRIARLERVLTLDGTIKTVGKKTFATNRQEGNFQTALEACKQAGGSIASPKNKGENDAVFSIVRLFNKCTYLGIEEHGIPGEVSSLDRIAPNYTNWHADEPSDIGEENCTAMCTDGAWNGTSCNQYCLTICEF